MSSSRSVLIVIENSYVPVDPRVWSEATTLRDAGWQVTVICPAVSGIFAEKTPTRIGTPYDLEGVTVYRFALDWAEKGIKSYIWEYLSAFVSISRLSWSVWCDRHFDIIHFCNPPDIFFPIGLFYRLLGARFVFDHHDLFPEQLCYRYSGIATRFLYTAARVTEYLTLRSANAIISTNESYRKIALHRGGISENRVVVLRNGPRTDTFVPVEPLPELKQSFPYMACYAGCMGNEDGVLELLASIQYVVCKAGRRDILFALLGDGIIRCRAISQVRAWGLESFVSMPGMIRDNLLLRQYLSTADVCLSPEPFTPLNANSTFIKIGEYMAMGKPIVAYDLSESRFTAQGAAVYVAANNVDEYGRAIVDLLMDHERRQAMGHLGRERILSELSWEHQKHNLFRAYDIALARGP